VPSCPDIVDPVLATDGRTYLNSCLANQAGARVVKHTSPAKLAGLDGAIFEGVSNTVVLAVFGLGAYLLLRKRR
jgi:hypothetical protein